MSKDMIEADVFISGAGIAGLATAARLAHAGLSVVIADPAPPPQAQEADGADLRSTAFLQPSKALFETCGLWSAMEHHTTPLARLRIIDTAGDPPQISTIRSFDSADLGPEPFGWNIPNWLARKVLTEALADAPRVDLRLGAGFARSLTRTTEARVTLTDGTRIAARLLIAADGRDSPLRQAAGIDAKRTAYGQKALAFVVTHEIPHDNVSTELYHQGGAFTLVPLPDIEGQPASAVVWMDRGPEAARRLTLAPDALSAEATTRSCAVLGDLRLASPVASFPVVTQTARSLTAERTIILAEAAHVLPPIGAQGLNTSLQDVAALGHLADTRVDEIGTPAFLAAYEKTRARDLAARAFVIDAFNRVCMSGNPLTQSLRSAALEKLHDLKPARTALMRAGLGG